MKEMMPKDSDFDDALTCIKTLALCIICKNLTSTSYSTLL